MHMQLTTSYRHNCGGTLHNFSSANAGRQCRRWAPVHCQQYASVKRLRLKRTVPRRSFACLANRFAAAQASHVRHLVFAQSCRIDDCRQLLNLIVDPGLHILDVAERSWSEGLYGHRCCSQDVGDVLQDVDGGLRVDEAIRNGGGQVTP